MRPTRRFLAALVLATIALPGLAHAAASTNPAENFVSDKIRAGLSILGDNSAAAAQRADRFQDFLLTNVDLKRIALFTLGNARATASAADQDAFVAAFRNYAVAVYRSYFQDYSGQTLAVTGSRENAPGDEVVRTNMNDPDGKPPLEVDFRVSLSGDRPMVVDVGIAGVWLSLAQRDDFRSWLAQHNNDVAGLAAHLDQVAQSYH